MTDQQKLVAELSAKILSGVLAGLMTKPNHDMGNVRPHHIQGSVNLALDIVEQVKAQVRG